MKTPQLHDQFSFYWCIFLFRTIYGFQCSRLSHHVEWKEYTGNLDLACWGSWILFLLPFSIPVAAGLGFMSQYLLGDALNQPGFLLIASHRSQFSSCLSNCQLCTFLVLPHSQLPVPWLIFFGWKAVGRWVTCTIIMTFFDAYNNCRFLASTVCTSASDESYTFR